MPVRHWFGGRGGFISYSILTKIRSIHPHRWEKYSSLNWVKVWFYFLFYSVQDCWYVNTKKCWSLLKSRRFQPLGLATFRKLKSQPCLQKCHSTLSSCLFEIIKKNFAGNGSHVLYILESKQNIYLIHSVTQAAKNTFTTSKNPSWTNRKLNGVE